MAAESKTGTATAMEQTQTLVMSPVIAPQLEQFWKAQDEILEEGEAFSKAWFARRHEATRTALDAVHGMNGAGATPAAAMRTLAQWQQGSLQRLADDFQQWLALCARCTGRVTGAEIEAAQEGAENVGKRVKSSAGARHATPV